MAKKTAKKEKTDKYTTETAHPLLQVENLNAFYYDKRIIQDINFSVKKNKVVSIMGPSGCGKTTLIRCVNRMHEMSSGGTTNGKIRLGGVDMNRLNAIMVRRKIGMVFQRPNPFPAMTIFENVIAGYLLNGIRIPKKMSKEIVEDSLTKAALWDEVKDGLNKKGIYLSGGQQQRLCIARALAMNPEVLLLDEPTSALDPKATSRIEELIVQLKENVTILIVTHNIAQAARVSDSTAFMYLGELVEYGPTKELFTIPKDKRTEEYLTGKFG